MRITKEVTVTLTHGGYTGAQDPLPDTSVISLLEVKQGGTTYVAGTDYKLTAGKVDWSLTGAEPAPGSTYTAKYQFIATVLPASEDDTGFTVEGAVVRSLVLVNQPEAAAHRSPSTPSAPRASWYGSRASPPTGTRC